MTADLKDKAEYFLKKEKLNVDLLWVLSEFMKKQKASWQAYRVRRIFNRPFSLVFNIEIEKEQNDLFPIFLKIYKAANSSSLRIQLSREYEITKYWYHKFKGHPYFHTVEPLWVDFNHFILITKESPGVNLLSFLGSNMRFFPTAHQVNQAENYLYLAGQWLAYFQRYPLDSAIPYLDNSIDIEEKYFMHYINVRMERMVTNPRIVFDGQIQKKVNAVIQQLCRSIDTQKIKKCVSHSDLSLSNILIYDRHVTVLDFHKSEINSPYKDLARLYHQLHLLSYKPEYSGTVIRRLQKALLRGWGNEQAEQQPLFKIYFLIHQISHLGKVARYWEHNFVENLYNRWVVRKTLKQLAEFLDNELQTKN